MKKSKIIPLIVCLVVSLLTGCSNEANESSPKQDKVSVEEIKDDIEQAMSREYAQFLMSDNVDYTVPTKIVDCTFTTMKDFAKNYESFILSVTESEKLNEDYLEKGTDFMGEGYVYDNPEEKKYAGISDNGSVSFFVGDMFHPDFEYPIKQVFVYGSSGWNSKFDFNNQEFSTEKAVEICNKWLEEKWIQYEPDFTFKPSYVSLVKKGNDDVLAVHFDKYYNGIKLCSVDSLRGPTATTKIHDEVRNSNLHFYITKSGTVEGFTTGTCSLEVKDKEEISEVMSLTSVLDFVEDKFSDYNKYDVVGVNLKYVLIYEAEFNNPDNCDANVSNSINLVWEILIKPDYPDFSKGDRKNIPDFCYINVDAVTGELDFLLDSSYRYRHA